MRCRSFFPLPLMLFAAQATAQTAWRADPVEIGPDMVISECNAQKVCSGGRLDGDSVGRVFVLSNGEVIRTDDPFAFQLRSDNIVPQDGSFLLASVDPMESDSIQSGVLKLAFRSFAQPDPLSEVHATYDGKDLGLASSVGPQGDTLVVHNSQPARWGPNGSHPIGLPQLIFYRLNNNTLEPFASKELPDEGYGAETHSLGVDESGNFLVQHIGGVRFEGDRWIGGSKTYCTGNVRSSMLDCSARDKRQTRFSGAPRLSNGRILLSGGRLGPRIIIDGRLRGEGVQTIKDRRFSTLEMTGVNADAVAAGLAWSKKPVVRPGSLEYRYSLFVSSLSGGVQILTCPGLGVKRLSPTGDKRLTLALWPADDGTMLLSTTRSAVDRSGRSTGKRSALYRLTPVAGSAEADCLLQ
jgi:hypothetical protein